MARQACGKKVTGDKKLWSWRSRILESTKEDDLTKKATGVVKDEALCDHISWFQQETSLYHRRQSEEGAEHHKITWGRPNTNTAYFDDHTATNVTAVVGQKAMLPCKVMNLDKRDVSWIRQRDLHILTVGIFTYTSDDRFQVYHPENSNEWFLEISSVTFRDAGTYECQVSTSPKIFLPVTLTVEVQQARINGPREIYIQNGSTIKLTCIVNTHAENVGSVTWYRDTTELDYDSPRSEHNQSVVKAGLRCVHTVEQCLQTNNLPVNVHIWWSKP
ncbi:LOW QUALITY PROTEIN: kin of IRRE-like protein 1 [Palaemon carinicauda]|uniref:LOW QUALITY PROTEIN: kin of IRRE-like protein 1 n=1 Tax=Palaemon carinicauda TaxID=392227 RepID=UPI0035B593E2